MANGGKRVATTTSSWDKNVYSVPVAVEEADDGHMVDFSEHFMVSVAYGQFKLSQVMEEMGEGRTAEDLYTMSKWSS